MQSVEMSRVPGEVIQALARRAPLRWLASALCDWLVIALAIGLFLTTMERLSWPWSLASGLVAVLVVGVWRHRLSLLGHDGAHYLITRNRVLNHCLSDVLVFWPNLLRTRNYENFHRPHHRGLGTEIDLELAHKRLNPANWQLPLPPGALRRRLLLSSVGGNWRESLLIMRMIGPKSWRDLLGPLLWWGTALLLIGSTLGIVAVLWILLIWNVATFTSFITVFHLRMLCEHHGTVGTHRLKASWLQRLTVFPYGEDCHLEHHRYPSVPFHQLARLREICLAQEQGAGQPLLTMREVLQGLERTPPIAAGTALAETRLSTP